VRKTTAIEWAEVVWNAATGCDRVSPGGDHCYMFPIAEWQRRMGTANYRNGARYTEHPDLLEHPLGVKKPSRFFVNSMSDMFHERATQPFVFTMLRTMLTADWHTFIVLTKRPGRMRNWVGQFCDEEGLERLPAHIWLGHSVENQAWADVRIPQLIQTRCTVRLLSCEPLLGLVDLAPWLAGLDWVICGGESGREHRPMDLDWARRLRDQCVRSGTAFFYKQSGGRHPGTGRELDGRCWEEYPTTNEVRPPVTRQLVLLTEA